MHLSSTKAKTAPRAVPLRLATRELALFSMLGALMFVSRLALQMLPNVHLLGLFVAAMTLAFRTKALIPLYMYIALEGLFGGFAFWWLPYLYVWLPLWGAFMLLGSLKIPKKARTPVYMLASGLHGLMFGILYAPLQALMFGLNFEGMLAWIAAGLPFDIAHGAGNVASGLLIVSISDLLVRIRDFSV